jgi:hypothetical protein
MILFIDRLASFHLSSRCSSKSCFEFTGIKHLGTSLRLQSGHKYLHHVMLRDAEQHNKLRHIILKTGLAISYTLPHRDELIIHRLRIGHTHLTHSHLLKRENAPICIVCQSALTVEHLLIYCTTFAVIRHKYFGSPPTLQELFKKIPSQNSLDFIKGAGVYFKI